MYTAPFTPPPLDAAPAFLHSYTEIKDTEGDANGEAGVGSGYFFVVILL